MSCRIPESHGGDGFSRRPRKFLLASVACAAIAVGGAGSFLLARPSFATTVPATSEAFQTPPSFADIIQKVTPAVVSVKALMRNPVQNMAFNFRGDNNGGNSHGLDPDSPFWPFLQQFHEWRHGGESAPYQEIHAQGSGFFVTTDGYIVTNNHVVKNATKVDVVTSDGRTHPAKIIGTDPKTDLAVLKIDGTGYSFLQFAEKPPRIGDWVIAMGDPFGLSETATAGIVSAKGRNIGDGPYDNFVQIDAPINHGDSGGPTFNAEGEVVGLNTAIYSPNDGSVGIGFAIPADTVQSVFTALKDKGFVMRGALDVRVQPVTQGVADALGMTSVRGALIDQADPNGPAAKAGIKAGDVITAIDGKDVVSAHDLARSISAMQPGTKVEVAFLRNGQSQTADVTLATLPGATAQRASLEGGQDNGLPQLGLSLAPSTEVPGSAAAGVVVTGVANSGVAADRGIKEGDVILDVNGRKVATPDDLDNALHAVKSDNRKMALLRIQSGDQIHFVAVPVA